MGLIHHYTDSGGLIGIIESRTIRATSVWFMNDSVEATFGWEQIEQFLASKSPSLMHEDQVIQRALEYLRSLRVRNDFPDSYIACFSEKENDLSQWRAYGRGKDFLLDSIQTNSTNWRKSLVKPTRCTLFGRSRIRMQHRSISFKLTTSNKFLLDSQTGGRRYGCWRVCSHGDHGESIIEASGLRG
jgi:hypothetical protein